MKTQQWKLMRSFHTDSRPISITRLYQIVGQESQQLIGL
jgi:hypothetical protein